jgi:hypothetical protein
MTSLAAFLRGAHATRVLVGAIRADELYACLLSLQHRCNLRENLLGEAPKVRAGLALAREAPALPR